MIPGPPNVVRQDAQVEEGGEGGCTGVSGAKDKRQMIRKIARFSCVYFLLLDEERKKPTRWIWFPEAVRWLET